MALPLTRRLAIVGLALALAGCGGALSATDFVGMAFPVEVLITGWAGMSLCSGLDALDACSVAFVCFTPGFLRFTFARPRAPAFLVSEGLFAIAYSSNMLFRSAAQPGRGRWWRGKNTKIFVYRLFRRPGPQLLRRSLLVPRVA